MIDKEQIRKVSFTRLWKLQLGIVSFVGVGVYTAMTVSLMAGLPWLLGALTVGYVWLVERALKENILVMLANEKELIQHHLALYHWCKELLYTDDLTADQRAILKGGFDSIKEQATMIHLAGKLQFGVTYKDALRPKSKGNVVDFPSKAADHPNIQQLLDVLKQLEDKE